MTDAPAEREARFCSLFDRHARPVLGYAVRRVDSPADAADVMADTFLIAWRRVDEVPRDAELSWLFATARRVLANTRRGEHRRSDLADRLRRHIAVTAAGLAAAAVDSTALRAALDRLDEDDRELILLSAWEGFTPAELATTLGRPAPTIRSRLSRARDRLRVALTAEEEKSEQIRRQTAASVKEHR